MDKGELKAMVLDHMEKGFLENIIDMFKKVFININSIYFPRRDNQWCEFS